MLLKIYGGEDAPDNDARKLYSLHDKVQSISFERAGPVASVCVTFDDGDVETFELHGNAYVMNDGGAPLAYFCPTPLPGLVHPVTGNA